MPLMSLGPSQLIPRIMSQRNMHEILAHTDPVAPLSSRILLASVTPHGGGKTSPLKVDTKQFTNLANWLIMISNQPNQRHQLPEQFLANPKQPAASTALVAPELVTPKPPADETTQQTPEFEKNPKSRHTFTAPGLKGLNGLFGPEEPAEFEPVKPGTNPLIDELMDPEVLNDPIYSKLLPDADLYPVPNRTEETKQPKPSEDIDPFDPDEFNRKFGK